MVDVLLLVREHGRERVQLAVAGALAAGAFDGRAVAFLAGRGQQRDPVVVLSGLEPRLEALDRPLPDLAGYDALIERGAVR